MKLILQIVILAFSPMILFASEYDYGMSFDDSIEQELYIKFLKAHGIDSKLEHGPAGMLWVVPDPEKRKEAEALSKEFQDQQRERFFSANS